MVVLKDLNNYNFFTLFIQSIVEMNSDSDTSEEGHEGEIKPYMFEPVATPTLAMTPNDSKAGFRLFRVQNRIQIFHQTFCFGDIHVDTCQCVVLSRLAFPAITIFATGRL